MNSQMVSWMKSNENLQVLGEERHVLRWHGHVLCHLAIGTPYTSVSCAPFKPCFGITTGSALSELNYHTTPSKACSFFLFHSRARPSLLYFFFLKCWFLQFCIKYFTFWYFLVFVFDKYLCFFKKKYMKINQ
jgi:hypothetical protein